MNSGTELSVTSEAGSESGYTYISIAERLNEGNSYKYKIAANPSIPAIGDTCSSGYTNWNGEDEIVAENGKTIVIVEVDSDNVAVAVGSTKVVSAE